MGMFTEKVTFEEWLEVGEGLMHVERTQGGACQAESRESTTVLRPPLF